MKWLRGCLLAATASLVVVLSVYSQQPVKGGDVRAVVYLKGGKVGGVVTQGAGTTWYEHNEEGRFAMTELARDEWSVYLQKPDGALIQLDLYTKKLSIVGGPLSAAEKQNLGLALKRAKPLYTISTAYRGKVESVTSKVPIDTKVPVVPTGKRRPFFIIGHHANTKAQVDDYVRQGANYIECDIHMYTRPLRFSGSDQLYVMHFAKDEFTRKFTNSDGVDTYFRNIKSKLDAGQLCGIHLDIKNTLVSDGPIHYSSSYPNPRHYGRVVANTMKRHGIPASRVIMGVERTSFAGGSAGANWVDEYMKGVRWDAQYDCLLDMYVAASGDVNTWANTLNSKSDVGSLGMDQSVRGAFSGYAPYVDAVVKRRNEKKGDLRFVYFWTVNSDRDMRNCLDRGVDGMITDEPARLKAIVSEPAYQRVYRIADHNDYPVPPANRVKRSLGDPFVYLHLHHRGGYFAKFVVTWTDPQGVSRKRDFGRRTRGWSEMLPLPRGATNIRVHAQADLIGGTWRDIYNGPVTPGSYTAGGTTLNRSWKRN